jgi:hypothetical protein
MPLGCAADDLYSPAQTIPIPGDPTPGSTAVDQLAHADFEYLCGPGALRSRPELEIETLIV